MHLKQNKIKTELKKYILLVLSMLHSPPGFDRFMASPSVRNTAYCD